MAADDGTDHQDRLASGDGEGKPVIVAIGASADGVRAPRGFFDALPARTGAAFVIIVHLDPEHRRLASFHDRPVSIGRPVVTLPRRQKESAAPPGVSPGAGFTILSPLPIN